VRSIVTCSKCSVGIGLEGCGVCVALFLDSDSRIVTSRY
jgi:hypothetical protein